MGALALGIINIFIVVVLLILLGLFIEWMVRLMGYEFPPEMRKFYLILVLLIALYMAVALIFGLPSISIIGGPMLR